MLLKNLILSFILVITLSACTTNEQQSTSGCPIKQYDNSKLVKGQLNYEAPESWSKVDPTSSMRLDEYVVDSKSNTVTSVYFFDGMRDAVEANLQRWKGQFKDDDARNLIQKKQYNRRELPLTIYHLTGTYLEKLDPMDPQSAIKEIGDYALLAAVVEMKNGTWFFKMLGPKAVVETNRASFDQLIDSFYPQE